MFWLILSLALIGFIAEEARVLFAAKYATISGQSSRQRSIIFFVLALIVYGLAIGYASSGLTFGTSVVVLTSSFYEPYVAALLIALVAAASASTCWRNIRKIRKFRQQKLQARRKLRDTAWQESFYQDGKNKPLRPK